MKTPTNRSRDTWPIRLKSCIEHLRGASASRAAFVEVLLTCVIVLMAQAAYAVDGVREINETCAVETGCFSGDVAGYPVSISVFSGARSYRLTSDLIVPDANTNGISVLISSVTIDLNGFEIVRSGCEGATTDCTPVSGSGSGVSRQSVGIRGISVKNGNVTGMGSWGVLLGDQAEVSGLRVRWNRLDGIKVGSDSTVSGNSAYQNGDVGIEVGAASTVSNNSARLNGDNGFSVQAGSTIAGNTAYQNGDDGIFANEGSTVTGNSAYFNGKDGIVAGPGSTISGNTVHSNVGDGIVANLGSTVSANTAYQNGDDGIVALSGSTISDNTATSNMGDGFSISGGSNVRGNSALANGGYGLNLSGSAGYRENVVTSGGSGTVNGGLNMFSNSCNGTATCP